MNRSARLMGRDNRSPAVTPSQWGMDLKGRTSTSCVPPLVGAEHKVLERSETAAALKGS